LKNMCITYFNKSAIIDDVTNMEANSEILDKYAV